MRPTGPLTLLAALLFAGHAIADEADRKPFEWLPGAARAIPRTTSASRDTPLLEYAYGPRAQASIGAEWGIFALHSHDVSLRLGFYGMVALENGEGTEVYPAVEYWRGLIGTSLSLSAESLARTWFGRGSTLELSVVVGHESDHRTDQAPDPTSPNGIQNAGGGDFVAPDLAVSLPMGHAFQLTTRVIDRVYTTGAFTQVPAADLDFRMRLWSTIQPIVAMYGEEQFSRDVAARNGFFARILAGLAFPGRYGEITPFYSLDMGTGKGFLINRREVRSSIGVRYAPF